MATFDHFTTHRYICIYIVYYLLLSPPDSRVRILLAELLITAWTKRIGLTWLSVVCPANQMNDSSAKYRVRFCLQLTGDAFATAIAID